MDKTARRARSPAGNSSQKSRAGKGRAARSAAESPAGDLIHRRRLLPPIASDALEHRRRLLPPIASDVVKHSAARAILARENGHPHKSQRAGWVFVENGPPFAGKAGASLVATQQTETADLCATQIAAPAAWAFRRSVHARKASRRFSGFARVHRLAASFSRLQCLK